MWLVYRDFLCITKCVCRGYGFWVIVWLSFICWFLPWRPVIDVTLFCSDFKISYFTCFKKTIVLLYITHGLTYVRTFQLAACKIQTLKTNIFSDCHRIAPLNRIWKFFTVFTKSRHRIVLWARWVHFTSVYTFSFRSILILFSR